jgi:hypothetical protein
MTKTIKLTFTGKPSERVYIIRQLNGHSSIGAMWSELERGTLEQMNASFNSNKYADCKKYSDIGNNILNQ